jgi:phospholipase/lecithinase/hemolysin
MKNFKLTVAALGAALLVAACGGGGDGNQAPKLKFTSMVSFGDSLSDVGSYNVGDVHTAGGGKFTVNGITVDDNNTTASKNWTERIAAQLQLPAPCAAETGLEGSGFLHPALGAIAKVFHGGCFNYAQGGARVTLTVGPANVANVSDPVAVAIGELTVPVVAQIQNHLKAVTQFSGTELVTVWAGANDVLQLLDELTLAATAAGTAAGNTAFANSLIGQLAAGATNPAAAAQAIGLAFQTTAAKGADMTTIVGASVYAAATQAGNSAVGAPAVYGPMVAAAQAAGATAGAVAGAAYATAHGPDLVVAMGTAGAQLAALVTNQIVAKGAKYVAVLNLPDVSLSPSSKAQSAATQGLIHAMVTTFNAQLTAGLANTANVKIVDIYANVADQVANPGPYGLTNVTQAACDMTKTPIVSAMLCTKDTLMAGDVSHYLFSDPGGHPTPFELKLISSVVARDLVVAGWL